MSVSASDVAKTYDGNRYGVKAEASVEGATIRYRDPATGEYTLKESPTFLDWTDGPQTVGFQATHPNYQTAYETATVTIDKRTVVLRSGDAEREYDGTALVKHEASVVDGAFVRGQEPEVAYYGSATNVADTHDGNNGFSYEFPEGVNADNYEVTTLFGTLAITPAPLLVTVTGAFDNVTFDGKPHTVEGFEVGDEAAGKATIALKDGERAYAEGVAAGRYPMNLTAEQFSVQSDNYRVTLNVVDGYLNIDKAGTLSVDAQPVVKTYDGSGYGVEAKASVDRAQIRYYNAETDAYDLTESPKYADAGTYIVKFQAALDNYNTAEGATTVTINPRAVTLTSADAAKPYDGTPLVAEDVIVSGGFVSGEGAAYSDFASLTDAGTLLNTFDYRLNEGTKASNYEVTKNCGTLKVEKAPLVVRIQGAVKSVAYNGALQAVDGYKVLDAVGDKASIELAGNAAAHAEGVDVGEYPMGLSPESFSVTSRNYEVTLEVADGKLAISPSGALTVSAEPVSAMYGGKRHGVADRIPSRREDQLLVRRERRLHAGCVPDVPRRDRRAPGGEIQGDASEPSGCLRRHHRGGNGAPCLGDERRWRESLRWQPADERDRNRGRLWLRERRGARVRRNRLADRCGICAQRLRLCFPRGRARGQLRDNQERGNLDGAQGPLDGKRGGQPRHGDVRR